MRNSASHSPHDGPIGIRAAHAVSSELQTRREFETRLWTRLMEFVEVEGLKESFGDLLQEDDPRRRGVRSIIILTVFLASLIAATAILGGGKLPFLTTPSSTLTQVTQEPSLVQQSPMQSAGLDIKFRDLARLDQPGHGNDRDRPRP